MNDFFYLDQKQKCYSVKGEEKSAFIVNAILTNPSK